MSNENRTRIIFVCGLSGAGKSVALHTLEDLDYYCIDNFPIDLLDNFTSQLAQYPEKIAIGINARNQEKKISSLIDHIGRLMNGGVDTELVFLEADEDVLTRRYSETRRKHPFSGDLLSLQDAIEDERKLLTPLAASAVIRIDTTHTTVHELRRLFGERIAGRAINSISIQLVSFGYKHGTPRDADFIFDVRCLPNPYWDKSLRNLSGLDAKVIEYLQQQPLVVRMADQLHGFFDEWLPCFEAENRSYLTIAAGCTGGRHRSVYLIERLAGDIETGDRQVNIRHRDLKS